MYSCKRLKKWLKVHHLLESIKVRLTSDAEDVADIPITKRKDTAQPVVLVSPQN